MHQQRLPKTIVLDMDSSESPTSAEQEGNAYNQRGTCEQFIKESKGAIKWTRLSCRTFAANAVRLLLHALAYNPATSYGPWRC